MGESFQFSIILCDKLQEQIQAIEVTTLRLCLLIRMDGCLVMCQTFDKNIKQVQCTYQHDEDVDQHDEGVDQHDEDVDQHEDGIKCEHLGK
ncbi:hypothetical protein BgiMline_031718 [Biomphalaria glabrata]